MSTSLRSLKHILLALVVSAGALSCTNQQVLGTLENVLGSGQTNSGLTNQEVISGLKQALSVGTENAAAMGSALDGFNANPRIRIPFPEDAIKVKNTAEGLGLGPQVEKFTMTLNRAAEEATKEAGPIFLDAIMGMSIQDGFTILRGSND